MVLKFVEETRGGVGTVRRADLMGVLGRAPVLTSLPSFILSGLNDPPSPTFQPVSQNYPLITDFTQNKAQSVENSVADGVSVDELCRLVDEKLSPKLSSPIISKTRYVACIDQDFPWMQVKSDPSELVSFMQSTSVEASDSDLFEENAKLRAEIQRLKELLLRFVSQ